ncbi:MAG: septum formation inhibitor Maf [Proteobacteria bacterium]|nr:septum formation inhibitor Maf [Pseudomonadota bacterium]NOG59382.1 septum formation inhibitor Maf [Pseudomonadota bacterium]
MKPNIVLASSSPYRKSLLERLDFDFICESPDIDEKTKEDEIIEHYVMRLAVEKAVHVAKNHPDSIIIGSDQSLECDGEILGKPGNYEKAKQQLTNMSGKSLIFYTGLCVLNGMTNKLQKDVIPYRVSFRGLNETEIERYLKKEEPYQCAGSFMSEKLGVSLLSKMEGSDPSALVGLPLIRLSQMLRNEGINVP